jgi:hypothetical protein
MTITAALLVPAFGFVKTGQRINLNPPSRIDSNRPGPTEARRAFAMFVRDCSFMRQGLGQERSAERAPRDGGNASRSACFWERKIGVETCVGDGGLSPDAPQPPAGRRQSPAAYRGAFALIEDSDYRGVTVNPAH